jgi:hypothetical protein
MVSGGAGIESGTKAYRTPRTFIGKLKREQSCFLWKYRGESVAVFDVHRYGLIKSHC